MNMNEYRAVAGRLDDTEVLLKNMRDHASEVVSHEAKLLQETMDAFEEARKLMLAQRNAQKMALKFSQEMKEMVKNADLALSTQRTHAKFSAMKIKLSKEVEGAHMKQLHASHESFQSTLENMDKMYEDYFKKQTNF